MKKVEMNMSKAQDDKKEQMSYEDLKGVANNMSQQNEQMRRMLSQYEEKLKELSNTWIFARLEYYFKFIDPKYGFPEDEVIKVKEDISKMLVGVKDATKLHSEACSCDDACDCGDICVDSKTEAKA